MIILITLGCMHAHMMKSTARGGDTILQQLSITRQSILAGPQSQQQHNKKETSYTLGGNEFLLGILTACTYVVLLKRCCLMAACIIGRGGWGWRLSNLGCSFLGGWHRIVEVWGLMEGPEGA